MSGGDPWPPLEIVAVLYPNSGGLAPFRIECTADIFERMSTALRSVGNAEQALGAALVSHCVNIELEGEKT